MNSSEALEKLLPAFEKFYTVKRQDVVCPFDAEAEFCLHTEKYVLVKAAKIADIDSNEFVYFSSQKKLDFSLLKESLNLSWDVIKNLAKSGTNKLKEWYEIFSGK